MFLQILVLTVVDVQRVWLETLCSLRLFLVRVTYVLLCCGTHNPKPLGKGWGGFCGPSHGPWQHGDGNVPTTAPSWD